MHKSAVWRVWAFFFWRVGTRCLFVCFTSFSTRLTFHHSFQFFRIMGYSSATKGIVCNYLFIYLFFLWSRLRFRSFFSLFLFFFLAGLPYEGVCNNIHLHFTTVPSLMGPTLLSNTWFVTLFGWMFQFLGSFVYLFLLFIFFLILPFLVIITLTYQGVLSSSLRRCRRVVRKKTHQRKKKSKGKNK
ncbi:hypothetical protein TbgDal_II2500 [Trypanosoma brucei gambiense DAL972]|uniref:Uncharacterized protein n=1 Tax=Trypanosoma brucei gambiense (strain MHOM/CI/86/DAL972) TaxID=679716 RepID=C9ZJE7_TRYB9|nr:hypothetical protein TbgDal_II2500 [Trypanosoma brucei gambiense DAL972]CBH09506.1 hypothetical protein TbgDal_II2500 [Trypanosoma brucei gambiense DAL972]|eukprot:XP_011771811.1 hypothetical protein TbgDal_II2500 [Trypanosoma brucei gambiense DAL972]